VEGSCELLPVECPLFDRGLLEDWFGSCDVAAPEDDGRSGSLVVTLSPSHVTAAPARYAANKFELPAYVEPVTRASRIAVW